MRLSKVGRESRIDAALDECANEHRNLLTGAGDIEIDHDAGILPILPIERSATNTDNECDRGHRDGMCCSLPAIGIEVRRYGIDRRDGT